MTLFLLISFQSSSDPLALQQLLNTRTYDSKLWQNLLHFQNKPNLKAPNFLLSSDNFSLKNELIASFNYLSQASDCRFIARQKFINHELAKVGSAYRLPEQLCADYQEYRKNVPADKLELVYASEILDSPTSMLGHIFIKSSGYNHHKRYVEHSLSFFNKITTANPLELISSALVTGMPGYFIVHPFNETVTRYVLHEQRNLYLYSLQAGNYRTDLLMAHLWELKQLEISYLFQSYNCATLTLFLLGILNEHIPEDKGIWVTPLDVVKIANNQGLINDYTGLFPHGYIDKINQTEHSEPVSAISYKPPQDKPSDSHVKASFFNNDQQRHLAFAIAPVSKELVHDSSQFIDESSLLMGEIEIGIDLNSHKPFLSQLKLYHMEQFSNDKHSTISTGYLSANRLSHSLQNHWYLHASRGVYSKLNRANLFYADLFSNLNLATSNSNIGVGLKAGWLYTAEAIKVHSEFSLEQNSTFKLSKALNLKAAIKVNEELYIELSTSHIMQKDIQENQLGLAISQLF